MEAVWWEIIYVGTYPLLLKTHASDNIDLKKQFNYIISCTFGSSEMASEWTIHNFLKKNKIKEKHDYILYNVVINDKILDQM